MKRAKSKGGVFSADQNPRNLREGLKPQGLVEIFVTRGRPQLALFEPIHAKPGMPPVYGGHKLDFSGCEILSTESIKNIIVNVGKDKIVAALSTGSTDIIGRMAVGDRGTLPSDSTVPKVPVATMDALYNEVYRADVEAVVLDVGTPTVHEVLFIKTFAAADIPITSFSNQAAPVLNEVGLITADPGEGIFPRSPVIAPSSPPADERLFSIRTYRSVPFEAANDIAVTIRYTIFIE